jgi:cytochrome c oxidase subunit 4
MASEPAPEPAARGEGEPPEPEGHVVSVVSYVLVYGALLGLTVVTVAAAFLDIGALHTPVAVAVAALKATLVALFFMHVRWSPRLIPLAAIAGVFWLAQLFGGTLSDYLTRGLLGVPGR